MLLPRSRSVVQLDTLPTRSAPGFTLAAVLVELIAHLQLFLVALLQQVCVCELQSRLVLNSTIFEVHLFRSCLLRLTNLTIKIR
jgi:hypothetical protein